VRRVHKDHLDLLARLVRKARLVPPVRRARLVIKGLKVLRVLPV
jgi:hypothetical protein